MTHNHTTALQLEDRIRGAMWGQLVGDAYCLGSHWIYSQNEIEKRFPDGIKGFETPHGEHYHFGKQSGDQTHYGDAALLMLSSVAQFGRFDVIDFGGRFIRLMSDERYSGYRDHATKGTLSNYFNHIENGSAESFDFQQGADDDQPATVTRLAPVVVSHLYAEELLDIVAQATRVCQNNARAIAFTQAAALIMQSLILGSSPESAVMEARHSFRSHDPFRTEVSNRMKISCAARMLSPFDATMLFGQSCPLYSSFTAALHTVLVSPHDFEQAIHATAQAGGDNAGRASMVGAWLGAHLGIQAIPAAWRKGLRAHDQIEECVEKIVSGLSRAGRTES